MSGIYIPGMEMPKHCGECAVEWCDKWKKLIVAGMSIAKSRPSDCPLVPVPPHGDLIDRDRLEKDIDKYIGGEESRSRFHHWVQVQSAVIPGNKGEQT